MTDNKGDVLFFLRGVLIKEFHYKLQQELSHDKATKLKQKGYVRLVVNLRTKAQ